MSASSSLSNLFSSRLGYGFLRIFSRKPGVAAMPFLICGIWVCWECFEFYELVVKFLLVRRSCQRIQLIWLQLFLSFSNVLRKCTWRLPEISGYDPYHYWLQSQHHPGIEHNGKFWQLDPCYVNLMVNLSFGVTVPVVFYCNEWSTKNVMIFVVINVVVRLPLVRTGWFWFLFRL